METKEKYNIFIVSLIIIIIFYIFLISFIIIININKFTLILGLNIILILVSVVIFTITYNKVFKQALGISKRNEIAFNLIKNDNVITNGQLIKAFDVKLKINFWFILFINDLIFLSSFTLYLVNILDIEGLIASIFFICFIINGFIFLILILAPMRGTQLEIRISDQIIKYRGRMIYWRDIEMIEFIQVKYEIKYGSRFPFIKTRYGTSIKFKNLKEITLIRLWLTFNNFKQNKIKSIIESYAIRKKIPIQEKIDSENIYKWYQFRFLPSIEIRDRKSDN